MGTKGLPGKRVDSYRAGMKATIFIHLRDRPLARGAGGFGFPSRHLAHLDLIGVKLLTQGQENPPGDIFRGRVRVSKGFELIQKGVIEFLDDPAGGVFNDLEIDQNAVRSKLGTCDEDLYLPIMPMKVFALAFELPELVRRSDLGNDSQFVHGCLLLTDGCLGLGIGLAAFGALSIDDDARAGSIRAEDASIQIKVLRSGGDLPFFFHGETAIHAEPTSLRDHKTTT